LPKNPKDPPALDFQLLCIYGFATDVVRIRNLSGLFGIAEQPNNTLVFGYPTSMSVGAKKLNSILISVASKLMMMDAMRLLIEQV
jgi:hypothetical protein